MIQGGGPHVKTNEEGDTRSQEGNVTIRLFQISVDGAMDGVNVGL